MSVSIRTPRFLLRELRDTDVTERYLGWFADPVTQRYITASDRMQGLADLRAYLAERLGRDDVLFLGIFVHESGQHVGNIKYEPVDPGAGTAVMGILVGEEDWRGRGVAGEVLEASAAWLREHRGIRRILLGVERDNAPAVKAYERVGFRIERPGSLTPEGPDHMTMVWEL